MSRTCSASRHAVIIATQIERGEKIEDPEYAAESICETAKALWKERALNSQLSAGHCLVLGGLVADEGGTPYCTMKAERDALLAALSLISHLSSQEWQEPDGTRKGATDNQGKRMWFVSDDVMREIRAAIAKAEGQR